MLVVLDHPLLALGNDRAEQIIIGQTERGPLRLIERVRLERVQLSELLASEVTIQLMLVDHTLRQALLGHLSLVDLLLHGALGQQTVNVDGPGLAETIYAKYRLSVVRRIPAGVKDNATVCADQIDTYAAGFSRDEEEASAIVRVVESVYSVGTFLAVC